MPLSQFDEFLPINEGQVWNPGDEGDYKTIGSTTQGSKRFDVILVRNSDTVTHLLDCALYGDTGPIDFPQAVIPALAGMGTHPPFDVLAALMPASQQQLVLDPGSSLHVSVLDTISDGARVAINALGGLV